MSEALERAKQIANRVLAGQYDLLLACRDLTDLREDLTFVPSDAMDVFIAVSSELDGVPVGPERKYWSAEKLREHDPAIAKYREQVRDFVEGALRDLLEVAAGRRPDAAGGL